MMRCEHELHEMDTACAADGMCPLCLSADRSRAIEGARRFVTWFDMHEDRLRATYTDAEFYELQEIADQNRELLK
jgi:hypothetical protein